MYSLKAFGILIGLLALAFIIFILIYRNSKKISFKASCADFCSCRIWIKRIKKLRWSLPLTFFLSLWVGTLLFSIFTLNLGSFQGDIYNANFTQDEINSVSNSIWDVINNSNYTAGIAFSLVVIFIILGLGIFLYRKKKLTFFNVVLLLIFIALITGFCYSYITDNIMVRQYDTWSSNQNGHLSITCSVYKTGFVPDPRTWGTYTDGYPVMDYAYQLYQPKLAYYINALWMHISDFIIGKDMYSSYQSIKALNFALYACEILLVYKAFFALNSNKFVCYIGTIIFAFSPQLIRFVASSSNEPLYTFFLICSIYLLIRFYKKTTYINLILFGLSIGLSMSCRLTAAWMFIPGLFVIILISIYKIKDNKFITAIEYILTFAASGLIIGLICPIYQKIAWNQPFGYVWAYLNSGLSVSSVTNYFNHFLYFDVFKYFNHTYMNMWNSTDINLFDSNMMTAFIRTSVFGEFNYQNNFFAYILWVVGFMFFITVAISTVAINLKLILQKRYEIPLISLLTIALYYFVTFFNGMIKENNDYYRVGFEVCFVLMLFLIVLTCIAIVKNKAIKSTLPFLVLLIVAATFLCAYQNFNAEYPYTCSQDFRLYSILLVPFAYYMGLLFYKGITHNSKSIKQSTVIYSSILLGCFIIGTVGLYISAGILS